MARTPPARASLVPQGKPVSVHNEILALRRAKSTLLFMKQYGQKAEETIEKDLEGLDILKVELMARLHRAHMAVLDDAIRGLESSFVAVMQSADDAFLRRCPYS